MVRANRLKTKKETKKQKDMEYSKYTKDTFPPRFFIDTVSGKTYEIPGDYYQKYTNKKTLFEKIKEFTKKKDAKDAKDIKDKLNK